MADDDDDDKKQPIIIKKGKKTPPPAHHGGAWKVAYADFVTAMMAFFLLLWLLNVTTTEQKAGIAEYFNPTTQITDPRVSVTNSGAESILAGQSIAPDGAMITTTMPLVNTPEELVNVDIEAADGYDGLTEAEIEEQETFEEISDEIKQALEENPDLSELANNLIIDETPEGLRIQIIDQENQSMFPSGSAKMFPRMKQLLEKLADIIKKAPNELSVRGHTDSIPYRGRGGYSNWELSADRANSSRKVLLGAGYPSEKIDEVVGKADTDHLFPDEPRSERNRRISIVLIKQSVTEAKDKLKGKDKGAYTRQLLKTPRRSNSIIDFE